jgi:hypothetical protein
LSEKSIVTRGVNKDLLNNSAPPLWKRFFACSAIVVQGHERLRFIAGVALIAVSFLVYLAYPFIPFLPFSGRTKIAVTITASVLSWGVFGAGIFLAGPEGYQWLKGLWRRKQGGGEEKTR